MSVAGHANYLQNLSSRASEHSTFAFSDGQFDVARRGYTDLVEGSILSTSHLVMGTLEGGAARHRYVTDCGYRYDGIDAPGSVSILPANSQRRLRLEAVSWRWAGIAISPGRFRDLTDGAKIRAFSTRDDRFLAALLSELAWHQNQDGHLDPAYLDGMLMALAQHLKIRYGPGNRPAAQRPLKLPPWMLRRIADYIEAQLPGEIRVATLARLIDLSDGHFHRAFRASTGRTPLQFINELRVQRAVQMLARHPTNIAELAFSVGFSSPTHFARVFRRVVGCLPSEYRSH
ncbi:AraC family transcriptional regulator (plasmid) [Rhizobium sullae]|uniref:AraC family transcriptional regulator n=1 Tax=Rhizobium sullae TaxID=50338 RepID=A0A2N0DG36_RHISU|nr:AraC family transcriptional regulator [Rhizobium sullae]PKA45072.1 AraC family transcriptional regulator [Rhizobium sullae]UWU17414.1 AraC family transcriptional regulator [Rhizobium sullae]